MFIGLVDAEGAGGIHGLVDEGEDIKVHVVDLDAALEGLGGGRIHAATTVIALQWLALHRAELAAALESGRRPRAAEGAAAGTSLARRHSLSAAWLGRGRMREFLRNNGLSLAFFALFLASIVGQVFAGWYALGEELAIHGQLSA